MPVILIFFKNKKINACYFKKFAPNSLKLNGLILVVQICRLKFRLICGAASYSEKYFRVLIPGIG